MQDIDSLSVKSVNFFVAIVLSLLAFQASSEPQAFWKRPENQKRLERRDILVSVHNEDERTWMKGVGRVRADLDRAFRFAQDYTKLAELPNHFSDVHFDPNTQILKMTAHLPFRKEKLRFKMNPSSEEKKRTLGFEVLEGMGKGSTGSLLLEDLGRQDSNLEVSLQAVTQKGTQFSWFLNVGVEALLGHVASSLRAALEAQDLAQAKATQ